MLHNTEKDFTILLFEDDEGQAELVKINLERSGIRNKILHFTDGNTGLDFLQTNKETNDDKYLIILDLNMPGMDGHQVLKKIKTNTLTKNIPTLILTTAVDDREIDRCYTEGCNLYVNKPLDYADFTNTINELGLFIQTAQIPNSRIK